MPIAYFNDGSQDIAPPTLTTSETVSEVVLRSGKFFECGKEFTDMTGKKFSLSEQEADALLPSFSGADLNVEHAPSVFDGLLGRVNRLYRNGKDIMAEYAIPKRLHEHMGGKPLKISSEWNFETKQPLGAALVLNPAVKDAVMMAAFSEGLKPAEALLAEKLLFAMTRHNTPEGQMAMQDLHDSSARAGAICDRKNVNMASEHESTAIQKIHNIAADHGATCKSGDKPSYYSKGTTMFDKLKALFKSAGVPDAEVDAHLTDAVAEFSSPGMTEAEKTRLAALEADNAQLKLASVKSEAETFAAGLIASGRALPYEKDLLIAQFCQAAEDDAKAPATVKFTALEDNKPVDKTGGRLDAFVAREQMRPAHGFMEEMVGHGRQLGEADLRALFNRESKSETGEEKAARIQKAADEELSKTEAGRKVLAARKI